LFPSLNGNKIIKFKTREECGMPDITDANRMSGNPKDK